MRPTSKRSSERPGAFARGGKGPDKHMVKPQSAGTAAAGRTGHAQREKAPGTKGAEGGPNLAPRIRTAQPARAGRTGPREREK
jgi:hypothetical protein